MADIIFFVDKEEFGDWLDKHHSQHSEVWVGYHKKHTRVESITWSDSVDAALCFGWIDGVRKTIDEQSYKIRFTPRKINSVWSAVNVKKVEVLIKLGKMRPEGMHVYHSRKDVEGYSSDSRNMILAEEYEEKIRANQTAWAFFNDLSPSIKRDSIWWVMSAKKEETQIRRLAVLMSSCEEGQKIPMLRKPLTPEFPQ